MVGLPLDALDVLLASYVAGQQPSAGGVERLTEHSALWRQQLEKLRSWLASLMIEPCLAACGASPITYGRLVEVAGQQDRAPFDAALRQPLFADVRNRRRSYQPKWSLTRRREGLGLGLEDSLEILSRVRVREASLRDWKAATDSVLRALPCCRLRKDRVDDFICSDDGTGVTEPAVSANLRHVDNWRRAGGRLAVRLTGANRNDLGVERSQHASLRVFTAVLHVVELPRICTPVPPASTVRHNAPLPS